MSGILLPVMTSAKSMRPASRSSRLTLMASSFVAIHDLDIPRRPFAPLEAYPPLIVDADAMLCAPIAVRGFEPVARRNPQVVELSLSIDGYKKRFCKARP